MFRGNTSLDFKDHALIGNGAVAGNSNINPIGVVIDFFDELSNGDNRDALSLAHLQEFGEAKQFSIVTDNFTDHGNGFESGQLHEFYGGFGVTGAFFNATEGCLQRNNVSRSN
jgi:hypothetical protein